MSTPQFRDYQMEQRSLSLTLNVLVDGTRWAALYFKHSNKWVPSTLLTCALAQSADCYLSENERGWRLVVGTAYFPIPAKHVPDIAAFLEIPLANAEVTG